jgi:hypothetical protein
MTNLSRALDVAEDKDKAFFDFNKLAEALNAAEEKKGKKTGRRKTKGSTFFRFQVVFLKEICKNIMQQARKQPLRVCFWVSSCFFFLNIVIEN